MIPVLRRRVLLLTNSVPFTEVTDNTVRLVVAGVLAGPDKSKAEAWGDTANTVVYEWDESDLSGTGVTPAHVNAGAFGLSVQVDVFREARVEHIEATGTVRLA